MLGQRLKEKRGKRTQEDVAEKLGISRARYSHYENNHVQPDNDLLQKMADFYNTSTDYLLGRTNDDKKTARGEPVDKNELIVREIVNKYNIDLTEEGKREKLEQIIRLVLDDPKKS